MKGIKMGFRQGFGAVAAMGLLGLVLGFALIPLTKASADVTCVAATQEGLSGPVVSDGSSCFIPSGVTITSATLSYTLDDGGDVDINGEQVFSLPPIQGVDSGTINLSTNLFNPGSSFIVRVTANNAMDSNGNTVGPVYGRAEVRVSTSTQQQTCQDPNATNYHTGYPCSYPQICEDPNAINYGEPEPCRPRLASVCTDQQATNYGGPLPCQYQQIPFPNVDLDADNTNLPFGGSTTLRWTVQNATSCTASGAWSGSKNPAGGSESTGSLTSTRTYSITCSNSRGSDSDSVTVNVGAQQNSPSVDISASPSTLCVGNSSQLSWNSSNATSASINQGIGSVSLDGNRNVTPSQTTTYTITVTNSSGATAQDSVTVNVNSGSSCGGGTLPTVDLRADDTSIDEGDETELTWDSTNADYCVRTGGRNGWADDRVTPDGDFDTGDLTRDTTYNIRCHNQFGSASDSVTVRVNDDDDNNLICRDRFASNYLGSSPCRYSTPQGSQPTVVIYADSTNLAYNGATFVRWSTVGATSCAASGGSTGWAGPKSIGPGSFYTGSLTSTRTYTLTCSNSFGSDTDSVTITVRPRVVTGGPTPAPQPASSLVIITSSIDRNQPIVPTLDNTRPRPGDEITYTVTYQNVGTAAIRNLTLRLDLPYEVNYLYSTPPNPIISGNTLLFNLGTLAGGGTGTVTVRVRVREDAPPGALLNFPAVLSYTDPAGFPQSVAANVSAQVWTNPVVETVEERVSLAASVFGAGGFLPDTLLGWLLLLLVVLLLILLGKYVAAAGTMAAPQPFSRKTTTTTIQQ